jgi:tetratricopeptide (TPR) repeat protein
MAKDALSRWKTCSESLNDSSNGNGKELLTLFSFRNIVLNLRQRQLIKRFSDATGSYISIHRSLQYSLLQMLSANPTDRQNVFLQACNMIRKVLPVLTELSPVHERQETYRSYEKFLPQVISLSGNISQLEPPLIPPLEFINLLCDAGTFMWDIGLVNQGIKIYQEAETMLDKIGVNPSDPIYARVSNVLGILYQRVGITMYKEVLKRKKRTLEIYENQLPLSTVCHTDEDLNRLQSGHNGVGIGLLFCGQFKEAEERFEKTKQIYERLGTEENTPYNFARYNINMALARCYQGKHEDAVRYADNAQRLVEEASTGQHGRAVYIKFLRGKVLSAAGRYREALPAQESVTILSASVSGESAYQTICCISEIGALNYRCGNLEMAEY